MKEAVRLGTYMPDSRVYNRLPELDILFHELNAALNDVMNEITEDDYDPDPNNQGANPPFWEFRWRSDRFRQIVYLKFRLVSSRPKCMLYSLHPDDYPGRPLKKENNEVL